jgi:hypothetical protein
MRSYVHLQSLEPLHRRMGTSHWPSTARIGLLQPRHSAHPGQRAVRRLIHADFQM